MTTLQTVLSDIQTKAQRHAIVFTHHARVEMAEETYSTDDVLAGIATAQMWEYYPGHRRGACCLLSGIVRERPIHIVCTTETDEILIVTVYEPLPPKWATPTQRRTQ
jgi:hypothetical protein